ncbi:FAD-binding oxidoreductase [Paenibacillus psychroresistens]|uniref:FAD-binding oxidoreductase n=1 Tax=Paenibacillus psychroresistens TaxID=1778678 RepID=A0A6B8RQR5_9BACL|nr:FAD-binding oxidoreductase [Paenibacillus psychroresistens]QGQ98339.1 FAD-binding oxidoreductase [Paenibacillus psychroresistens]
MKNEWKEQIAELLGESKLLLDTASLEKYSKDYYWYSPILEPKLKHKLAEGIVLASNEQEVNQVLTYAYSQKIPVTVRGAGTGNYGQAVPLEGGIVLDVSGLDKVVEIGDGYVRVQCGMKMGVLEKKVREQGQELRMYPSTFVKATIGGFISGGSGGIGSISWGTLWDDNVLEAIVYTMEENPQRLVIRGAELHNYIHNYGTTGILTEVVIRLCPSKEWVQSIVSFESLEDSLHFAHALAHNETIPKRLLTPMEWPIPSFFVPLAKHLKPGAHVVFLETEDGTLPSLTLFAAKYKGRVSHVIEAAFYHKVLGLSDFTWNHTTLWALKAEPTITYIQAGFSPENFISQMQQIKAEYGDEVLLHFEWMRSGVRIVPGSIPLIRFTNEARLYEIIRFFESIGVSVSDPHVWTLKGGAAGKLNNMQKKKLENDPLGLLNPGKIAVEI